MSDGLDRAGWSTGTGPTETDRIFLVLAHPCRRFVLEYLDAPGDEATLTELAAALARASGEAAKPAGVSRGIDTMESALYHVHVPKLIDADLVAFDPDRRTVTLTDRVTAVRPILDAAANL